MAASKRFSTWETRYGDFTGEASIELSLGVALGGTQRPRPVSYGALPPQPENGARDLSALPVLALPFSL